MAYMDFWVTLFNRKKKKDRKTGEKEKLSMIENMRDLNVKLQGARVARGQVTKLLGTTGRRPFPLPGLRLVRDYAPQLSTMCVCRGSSSVFSMCWCHAAANIVELLPAKLVHPSCTVPYTEKYWQGYRSNGTALGLQEQWDGIAATGGYCCIQENNCFQSATVEKKPSLSSSAAGSVHSDAAFLHSADLTAVIYVFSNWSYVLSFL